MTKGTRRTEAEVLAAFADLFDEIEFDAEEVDEILIEAGYDLEELDREIREVVDAALAASPFNPANHKEAPCLI